MDRRELLKMIGAATGCAFIGSPIFLVGCRPEDAGPDAGVTGVDGGGAAEIERYVSEHFTAEDVELLADIAETIMPATDTPGARDADVAPFMTKTVDNCYSEEDQDAFHAGLVTFREECEERHGEAFTALSLEERTAHLTELDREAREYVRPAGGSAHYFTMMKQLTLFSYFTSEIVQKQVLRHVPTPGYFDGCYPYAEGDRAWAI